ncbi:MAG: Flp family type IVb pilin [Hyphomicrobiaceae bacterium]
MTAFRDDESGGVAIEYVMIAGFIALGIISLLVNIGTNTSSPFYGIEAGLKMRGM